jgi:hypothetical protein
LWSSPTFEVDACGAVTFAKNAYIREVAVYNDTIEYDMGYKTNNFGFVDDIDYNKNEIQNDNPQLYAFVGDSFTAGSGGQPWVLELRKKLRSAKMDIMIYNFSIPGAGLRHFLKLLETNLRKLTFTHIVILAISNDMNRPYYVPITENGKVYFWAPDRETREACLNADRPTGIIIGRNATEREIIARVKSIKRQRNNIKTAPIKNILNRSRFLALVAERLNVLFLTPGSENNAIDLAPLMRIRLLYPKAKIYFIHLPSKDEVKNGKYRIDLQNSVESLRISYYPALTLSRWSEDMFYKRDPHPNNVGYRNISDCVEKILFNKIVSINSAYSSRNDK